MSELKPCQYDLNLLNDRILNLGAGLATMPENGTMQVNKAFLAAILSYMEELLGMRRAQPDNEPLITCGECAKYQTPDCAAKHEQALMDFCSHGIRKPGGEQE